MKINVKLLKFIIRMIILLIMLVMLFIISVFLYSARFWPDVYNYINANITIKRIPTISELNPVIYEVEFATEMYSTTDAMDYQETSTLDDDLDFNFDDFLSDQVETKRRKRQIPVEEMKTNYDVIKANYDYVFDFEVTTAGIVKDLVDENKLTTSTSKDVEIITKIDDFLKKYNREIEGYVVSNKVYEDNGIESIFPWIATVFVKSDGTDQFEYVCDGSLVSERVVLTAARCLKKSNVTEDAGNVLIILGKRSLQATGPNEKVIRVNQIKLHENFTDVEGKLDNDLAIIVLDEAVAFNDDIQKALLSNNEDDDDVDSKYSATTGWHITGTLTPIYFNKESKDTCVKNTVSINTFCARFGDGITTCPSFGGAFVIKNDAEWRLQGISTGKPTSSGVCFNKNVTFTNIRNYFRWIMDNVNINKDY